MVAVTIILGISMSNFFKYNNFVKNWIKNKILY